MRLFISNSKSPAATHAKVICGISFAFLIALEGLSAYMLKHHSVTYRRVSQQLNRAVGARPAGTGEPASVVMIGNSLFLDGIQVDRLQELTSERLRIYPIFLEATGYYDWLYGLRRIFRLGARPEVVVVQLEAISLLWNRVRTEYSPMLFFDAPDLVHVSSDLGLGRTAESSLLLAHWSAFSSAHSVIRTQILRHTIPHFSELFVNLLIQARRPTTLRPDTEEIAEARLKTLRDLCDAHRAKLILLAPPVPSSESAVRKLVDIAERIGVATLVPIEPKTLTTRHYEPDVFHLNAEGAALFTSAIARISDQFLYGKLIPQSHNRIVLPNSFLPQALCLTWRIWQHGKDRVKPNTLTCTVSWILRILRDC